MSAQRGFQKNRRISGTMQAKLRTKGAEAGTWDAGLVGRSVGWAPWLAVKGRPEVAGLPLEET